jgi:hypothetical protein
MEQAAAIRVLTELRLTAAFGPGCRYVLWLRDIGQIMRTTCCASVEVAPPFPGGLTSHMEHRGDLCPALAVLTGTHYRHEFGLFE